MPKVLRSKLPHALMAHLHLRIRDRSISLEDLELMLWWLDTNPEVPHGRWFKRFPGMTVCGEGELVKTFPLPHQAATGEEIS